jgi:beta-glucosidase-like glycosyl hydrolase
VTSAAGTAFAEAVSRVRSGAAKAAAGELLALLEPIVAGAVERLGVPGLRFSDGPRGAVLGRSTAFPVPMARGATWDPELEERTGARSVPRSGLVVALP